MVKFKYSVQFLKNYTIKKEVTEMVQMNRFAGQKLRHRCREQTYGHQGGKVAGGVGMGVC